MFYFCNKLLVIHLKTQATVKNHSSEAEVSHIFHLIAHVGNDVCLEHWGIGGGCSSDQMCRGSLHSWKPRALLSRGRDYLSENHRVKVSLWLFRML